MDYIIGSLLKQLVSKNYTYQSFPRDLLKIYERNGKQKISPHLLLHLMSSVCSALPRVHIIIDGLDELSSDTQDKILSLFGLHPTQKAKVNVSVLFFSRPHLRNINVSQKLEIVSHESDLRSMINSWMKEDINIRTIVDGDTGWAGRVAARISSQSAGQ
jgi:hypothetical protein